MISTFKQVVVLFFLMISWCDAAQIGTLYEQSIDLSNSVIPNVIISGNSSLANNQTLSLNAQATVCNTCTSFYYWSATGGQFQGIGDSPNVTWVPPVLNTIQTYDIQVTVGDGKGRIATAVLSVTVTPTINACQAGVSTPRLYDMGGWSESSWLTVDWQTIGNATGYVLQESSSPSFSAPVENILTGYASASQTLYNKANGTYYYRVKAQNSCGASGWSNTSTRVVQVNSPPNIPANAFPSIGYTGASRTPTLTWTGGDIDGQAEYAVEFGTDPNAMWFIQGYGDSNSFNTYKMVDWSLNPSTLYYWRVRARDDRGAVTFGPIWSFTTAATSADLVPISATVTGTIANGNTVTMNVVVQNQGDFPSDGGVLRFYYSPYENGQDFEYTGGRFRGIPILQPGASATISIDLPINGLLAGSSYLVTKVDTYLFMTERDISNNFISYPINYMDTTGPNISFFDFRWGNNGIYKTIQQNQFTYSINDDIAVSSIDLMYSSDNGISWTSIASNYPVTGAYSTGNYQWAIPGNTPLNSTFLVKMIARDTSGNISSIVRGPYTLIDGSSPVVTWSSPMPGEVWNLNSAHPITWTATSPNGIWQVNLTYYYNNGNSAQSIASFVGNPGSYTWTLPALASYASTSGQIVMDVTDNNFNSIRVRSGYFTTRDVSAPPPAPWVTPGQATVVTPASTLYTSQNNDSPVVAVDAAGNTHMAYVYSEDNISAAMANINSYPGRIITYKLYYTKKVGTTWTTPVAVRSIVNNHAGTTLFASKYISNVRLSVGPSDVPSLVWSEGVDAANNLSELFFSYLNGAVWTAPVNLSNNSNVGSFTWNMPTQPGLTGGRVRLATIGSDIYASGFGTFLSLYKYSTFTNTWTQLADVPGTIPGWWGVSEGDMCANNGLLYAADQFGNFISYNPVTNTWIQKASLLTVGWGLRLKSIGGKIYVVGARATTALQEYNPVTNTWVYLAPMPTAREFPAVSTLNNKLQVIGGRASGGWPGLRNFEEYDPVTNVWTKKPDTAGLGGIMGGAEVLNGKIYLTAQDYAVIEAYDPVTNLWMPVDKLPTQMGSGDIAVANSNLYVLGSISWGGSLTFNRGVFGGVVDVNPTMSWNPKLAIDSNNIAHVLWRDGCHEYGVDGQSWTNTTSDCTFYYRNFNITSGVWSPISMPLPTPQWVSEYDMTISSDNALHLAFVPYDPVLGRNTINYTRNGGTGWSTPSIAVSDYSGSLSEIDLSIGVNGTPMLVGRTSIWSPFLEKIIFSNLINGVWTAPEIVVSNTSYSYSTPRVFTDAAGSPVVAYKNGGNWSAYITKRLADGSWSNGLMANTASQQVNLFDAAVDLIGNKLYLPYSVYLGGHYEIFLNVADLAADFIAPTISLSGIVDAATVTGGAAQQLYWTASDDKAVTSVDLKYTTDGGVTYNVIATGLVASGSYGWVVPNIASGAVQVVAVANDAAGNQCSASSGIFALSPRTLTSIQISGTGIVDEGTSAMYTVSAYYDTGASATVTNALSLTLTPFATLSANSLAGNSVAIDQIVTLNASYTEGGMTSTASIPVTIRNVPTVPGAPTGASATAGILRAMVNFSVPANNGDSPIISYTVTSNPGGITATGITSPIAVTGLTAGIPYTFTVKATNIAGVSLASLVSNSVTPVNPSFTVLTSAGANGTISPASLVVVTGSTASFTVTSSAGFSTSSVTGCGGSLLSNTYTTAAITADCTVMATFTANAIPLNLVMGWNLVGNSVNAPLDVASTFNDPLKFQSIWKWVPASNNWAFFTPSLTTPALTTYATSKGYVVLATINGGEGFWVNAKVGLSVPLPVGVAINSSNFADQFVPPNLLPLGWSLISTGDNPTPRNFVNALAVTPPVTPAVAATSLTTLWAWDSALSNWYFYAPSLDNSGGLANYITTKGYLNFGAKTLDPTMGFWVNHP